MISIGSALWLARTTFSIQILENISLTEIFVSIPLTPLGMILPSNATPRTVPVSYPTWTVNPYSSAKPPLASERYTPVKSNWKPATSSKLGLEIDNWSSWISLPYYISIKLVSPSPVVVVSLSGLVEVLSQLKKNIMIIRLIINLKFII